VIFQPGMLQKKFYRNRPHSMTLMQGDTGVGSFYQILGNPGKGILRLRASLNAALLLLPPLHMGPDFIQAHPC